MIKLKTFRKLFFLTVLLYSGCNNNNSPFIDELVNDIYTPRNIVDYQVNGMRDGANTKVLIKFILDKEEQVELDLDVSYNPTPVLRSGIWRHEGNNPGSGIIKAKSLKFLGGQGEAPSLGGRFELSESSKVRFRATIPLRPISKPSW